MKKTKFLISIFLLLGMLYCSSNLLATDKFGGGFDYNMVPTEVARNKTLDEPMRRAWNTVATILQIVSIGGIIITGLRYMYSSADKRADLKTGMIPLVIGMVLVFGATTILDLVVNSYDEVANPPAKVTPKTK